MKEIMNEMKKKVQRSVSLSLYIGDRKYLQTTITQIFVPSFGPDDE